MNREIIKYFELVLKELSKSINLKFTKQKLKNGFGIFSIILMFISCSKTNNEVQVTPPTIILGQITNVTDTSALIGAQITFDGNGDITERGVLYSSEPQLTFNNAKILNGIGRGAFETIIKGLLPGKKYYVKAFAVNSAGTSFTEEKSFETSKALPSITTTAASSITLSSAMVGGNITKDGGSTITARGIVFGVNPNPSLIDNKTTVAGGIGSFESEITGIKFSTKYYVRAYATNDVGTAYGNEISFTTLSPDLPTLTTRPITNISSNYSFSGGDISNNGGAAITERGICWSKSKNPTISDNKRIGSGSSVANFTAKLDNLTGNTLYYVRAYATNGAGTAYGSELSFTTLPSITDIDGNIYNTVLIGDKIWMSENLKVTKYRNGDPICLVLAKNDCNTTDQKWRFLYDNNSTFVATFGNWYTWYSATDQRGLCPVGTHLPNSTEWVQLINTLGQNLNTWTNINGFNALYGGVVYKEPSRDAIGQTQMGVRGYYLSSTPFDANAAFINNFSIIAPGFDGTGARIDQGNLPYVGMSVRCIRD
jgi:uncharacterized protein (TIGR02145 family)